MLVVRFSASDGLTLTAVLLMVWFLTLSDSNGVGAFPRLFHTNYPRPTPNVTHPVNWASQAAPELISGTDSDTNTSLHSSSRLTDHLNQPESNATQSKTRTKRASFVQPGLDLDQNQREDHALDKFFHMPTDFSGTYTTETLPDDLGTIRPNQWIFFRVCTQPLEERNYHPDGLEEHVREKIKFSCLSTNKKRPTFWENQNLIITVRGAPVIQFDILSRRTHILLPVFRKDMVKFWLLRSRDTVLVGLRPQPEHSHQVMDLRLETHVRFQRTSQASPSIDRVSTMRKSKSSKPRPTDYSAWTDDQPSAKMLKHVTPSSISPSPSQQWKPVQQDDRTRTETVHTIYLKQFTLMFVQDPFRLSLRCNKTGTFILYDPRPLESSNSDAQPPVDDQNATYHGGARTPYPQSVTTVSFDAAETLDRSEQPNKVKPPDRAHGKFTPTNGSRDAKQLSQLSTDLLVDTDTPEPLLITEAMDELVIRLAQPYVDPNPHDTGDAAMSTVQRTSDSLLIPTEPTSRTLVQVIPLGETLHFTCQGLVPDGQLRVLFDRDAWHELYSPFLWFHNTDGSDQELQVTLRASRITWANVTPEVLDQGLRQLDALTNIKCGSYRSSRLSEHPLQTHVQRIDPVQHLYFVIVSAEDHTFITHQLAEKLSDTFESMRSKSTKPNAKSDQTSLFKDFYSNVMHTAKTERSKPRNIGFWNWSLSNLSNMKLFLTVILVTLILSFIVIVIRNYARMRTEFSTTAPAVSRWTDSGDGNALGPRRSKPDPAARRTGSSRTRTRAEVPHVSEPQSMSNSNAADHNWFCEPVSKQPDRSSSSVPTGFSRTDAGLVRRPRKAVK